MSGVDPLAVRTFHWADCVSTLEQLASRGELVLDTERRYFESRRERVTPPLVFPIAADCRSLAQYLDDLPPEPGVQTLILMQAGAASLGRFDGGENLVTKSTKRYVVRGKGRAQPTYLATKGKSRYGSRLRLANAQRLMVDVNERLADWEEEFGPAEQIYYACPVRLWSTLFDCKPAPPFDRNGPLIRVPLDLPRPTTDVLLRTYRSLCFGRIVPVDCRPVTTE